MGTATDQGQSVTKADDEADDLRKHEQADCGDVPGTGAMTDPIKHPGQPTGAHTGDTTDPRTPGMPGQKGTPSPKVENAPASTPTGSPTSPGDPSDSGAPAG